MCKSERVRVYSRRASPPAPQPVGLCVAGRPDPWLGAQRLSPCGARGEGAGASVRTWGGRRYPRVGVRGAGSASPPPAPASVLIGSAPP